jgi:hypothetical protein
VLELDRAGAVDEGEAVAQKSVVGDVELDAHAVGAGLGGGVADVFLPSSHRALPRDRAGARQDGLEQRRLAAEIGTDQCDAAGAAAERRS